MADNWDGAVKEAQKILGDKGKIPKVPSAVHKAGTADDKSYKEFCTSREDLKAKLLATQNTQSAVKDAQGQFQDEIDESDLGLNSKDKDDAKKIVAARKVLSGYIQDQMDNADTNLKNLKELDKHLMSLVNYQQCS